MPVYNKKTNERRHMAHEFNRFSPLVVKQNTCNNEVKLGVNLESKALAVVISVNTLQAGGLRELRLVVDDIP